MVEMLHAFSSAIKTQSSLCMPDIDYQSAVLACVMHMLAIMQGLGLSQSVSSSYGRQDARRERQPDSELFMARRPALQPALRAQTDTEVQALSDKALALPVHCASALSLRTAQMACIQSLSVCGTPCLAFGLPPDGLV